METRTSFYISGFEIDKMGIAHHSNYPRWFEIGRSDYLKKAGIPSSTMNKQGFYLPLSEMECRFKSPAKFGDKVAVITRITLMTNVMVKFEYKIINEKSDKLLATGKTVHAWTGKDVMPLDIERAAPQIYTTLKTFAG